MPTEITITAYTYAELEGRAKDNAREKLTQWATDHEWWEYIYDDAKERGKEYGYDIEDIRFSGFWSQGDGASWTGDIDLVAFIEKLADKLSASFGEDMLLVELMRNGWVNKRMNIVRRSYHYCHENTMTYDYHDWDDWQNADDAATLAEGVMAGASVRHLCEGFSVEGRLQSWINCAEHMAKDYARDIYRALEEGYDDLVDDERLAEFASANEYLFDENGRVM